MRKDMFDFTSKEEAIFKKLSTPAKIQDFLNRIPINFEIRGETAYSPRGVLLHRKAHCMEGAMFAAAALRVHGHPPLIVDMAASKNDEDHVIAVFKHDGCWGSVSKTNHAVLRYREPVYKTIHELVMSYFHEYFTNHDGRKTLRSYAGPVNLSRFDARGWMTATEDVWYIPEYLARIPHLPLLSRSQIAGLHPADPIERRAGELVEWKKRKE